MGGEQWTVTSGGALQLLVAIAVLLLSLAIAVRVHFSSKFRYWKNRGVHGPEPSFPFGNALRIFPGAWHDVDLERVEKYGRVFGVYEGTSPCLVVTDPEILEQVLIKDFHLFVDKQLVYHKIQQQSLISSKGKKWKYLRSIISPSLTTGKIKAMHQLMKHCVSRFETHLLAMLGESGGSADVDILENLSNMTMDVIASCAFGLQVDPHQDPGNVFVVSAKRLFELRRWPMLLALYLPSIVSQKLNFSSNLPGAYEFMASLSQDLLDKRRTGGRGDEFVDVLQLLIDAESINPDGSKNKLTDVEIVANIINVLGAGYVTTRTLIVFAVYFLAKHPEHQERLRREVQAAYEADHNDFTYDTITSLPFLGAVVNETLRMFPPVPRGERRAGRDYEIKKLRLRIKKGTSIHVPIYAIHHQEEFFPNSFHFDPERFMPGNAEKQVPCTFLPFLTGPRNCIGYRFALLEAKTTIASLLLKFKLESSAAMPAALDFSKATIILQPTKAVVKFSLINHA